MIKYDKYKQCSIEWVNSIPYEWDLVRLKALIKTEKNGVWGKDPEKNDKDYYVIRVADIDEDGYGIRNNINTVRNIENADNNIILNGDELLLEKSGGGEKTLVGRIVINNLPQQNRQVTCSNFMSIIRVNNTVDREYLYYLFRVYYSLRLNYKHIKATTGIQNIDTYSYFSEKVPLPNIQSQHKIVNELKKLKEWTDELVGKKIKYISLLKEFRTTKINELVTRGLSKNKNLKNSGIEWLPQIPEDWETLKIRHMFYHVKDKAPTSHNFKLISLYTETGVDYRENLEQKGNKASTTDNYWIVRKGDIVINKLLAWMGSIGYSNLEGVTSPAYDVIRSKDTNKYNPEYFGLLFRNPILKTEYRRFSRGILDMKLRLYFSDMGQILFPVPPHNEQCEIVSEVEIISNKYSDLIRKAERQIELIQEYRQSLIYELVTGKRKP